LQVASGEAQYGQGTTDDQGILPGAVGIGWF